VYGLLIKNYLLIVNILRQIVLRSVLLNESTDIQSDAFTELDSA